MAKKAVATFKKGDGSGGYMEYFHTFVWANLQLSDWEQSVNRTYNTLINNK